MISFECKNYKEKYKISISKNNELKKSNEDLEKKIKTLEESLSQANKFDKTDEPSIVEKLREEVACLTKYFGKFLESSITLTMLLKYHQIPMISVA